MIKDIINLLGIEGSQLRNDNLSKSIFIDEGGLEGRVKRLFQEDISKIILVGVLNESSSLIPVFTNDIEKYEEIDIIYVELNSRSHFKEIADVIQKIIPNPLIIIFIHEKEFQICTARKRLSLTEKNSQVIESIQYCDWLDFETRSVRMQCYIGGLGFQNFSQNSLRSLYLEFSLYIYQSRLLDIFPEWEFYKFVEIESLDPLLNKYEKLNSEFNSLEVQIKKMVNWAEELSIKKKIIEIEKNINAVKCDILSLLDKV